VAVRARALNLASNQLFKDGDAQKALDTVATLDSDTTWRRYGEVVRLPAMAMFLRVDEAADAASALIQGVPKELSDSARASWQIVLEIACVNTAVNAFVTAGRYEEALSCESAVSPDLLWHADPAIASECALLHINLAEAEMNVGRAEQALKRLDHCDKAAQSPLTTSGLAMQRGWILGTLGQGELALAAMANAAREPLGLLFASEFHLSHAFALLALGEVDAADREVDTALEVSKRPSTVRNALFLKARVAERSGDDDKAEALCAEATNHPHRWQGGDGLLFAGDLLARRGKIVEARGAWLGAVERDPQSASARLARARLAEVER